MDQVGQQEKEEQVTAPRFLLRTTGWSGALPTQLGSRGQGTILVGCGVGSIVTEECKCGGRMGILKIEFGVQI